jgi:predicted DNA-binding protein
MSLNSSFQSNLENSYSSNQCDYLQEKIENTIEEMDKLINEN